MCVCVRVYLQNPMTLRNHRRNAFCLFNNLFVVCRAPFWFRAPPLRSFMCACVCEWLAALFNFYLFSASQMCTWRTRIRRCVCVFAFVVGQKCVLFLIYFVDFNFAMRCAFNSGDNGRTGFVAHTPGVIAYSAQTAASTSSHLSRAQRLCCWRFVVRA